MTDDTAAVLAAVARMMARANTGEDRVPVWAEDIDLVARFAQRVAERERALEMKVQGQEYLLRAYRLGTRPPEKAFTLIARADKILAAVPQPASTEAVDDTGVPLRAPRE